MPGRYKPAMPMAKLGIQSARLAMRPQGATDLMQADVLESIKTHLGGEEILNHFGVHDFVVSHDDVTFKLRHPNANNVRTVVIMFRENGLFEMNCYGDRQEGTFTAPLIGSATGIVPENLATVLGKLTGIEELHHRHF